MTGGESVRSAPLTAAEREAVFVAARDTVYDLPFDPLFIQFAGNAGVDLNAPADANYWQAVADYSLQGYAAHMEAGKIDGQLSATTLLAIMPDVVRCLSILDLQRRDNQYWDAKRQVSVFNKLIREAADNLGGLRASELLGQLYEMVNEGIRDPDIQKYAQNRLRVIVRGAQHEKVFGEMLKATGLRFAPTDEGLDMAGVDYIVQTPHGPVGCDVKASTSELTAHAKAGREAYSSLYSLDARSVVTSNGFRMPRAIVFSVVTDDELRDGFSVPEGIIRQRAPLLAKHLEHAGIEAYTRPLLELG